MTAVIAKLANVLPDNLRREVAQAQEGLVVSGLLARDYRPWMPVLDVLRRSVVQRRALRITYRNFRLEESCREIEPYARTFRGGLWYLVAYCRLRDDMRTFRVDRIQGFEPVDRNFVVPEGFSAQAYIEQTMQFENNYEVVVHLDRRVAPYVREHTGHWTKWVDHEDGSITVRFDVSGLDWNDGVRLTRECEGLPVSLEVYQTEDVGQHDENERQGCDADEVSRYTSDKRHYLNTHLYASKYRMVEWSLSVLIIFVAVFTKFAHL